MIFASEKPIGKERRYPAEGNGMKCSKCSKEIADDMTYCGYCGGNVKTPQGPPLLEQLAEHAVPLGDLVERVAKAIGELWIKAQAEKLKHRTYLSLLVISLVALVVIMAWWLASEGALDPTFSFLAGTVLGALITLVGDLMLSD